MPVASDGRWDPARPPLACTAAPGPRRAVSTVVRAPHRLSRVSGVCPLHGRGSFTAVQLTCGKTLPLWASSRRRAEGVLCVTTVPGHRGSLPRPEVSLRPLVASSRPLWPRHPHLRRISVSRLSWRDMCGEQAFSGTLHDCLSLTDGRWHM